MADREGLRPAADAAPQGGPRVLPRACARPFYNAADALVPPAEGGAPGAGDLDLLPRVELRLFHEGPAAARRLGLWLLAFEWTPLLRPGDRCRFSQLPRARRRALLADWAAGRCGPRRRAVLRLRALVEDALAAARAHSSEGA